MRTPMLLTGGPRIQAFLLVLALPVSLASEPGSTFDGINLDLAELPEMGESNGNSEEKLGRETLFGMPMDMGVVMGVVTEDSIPAPITSNVTVSSGRYPDEVSWQVTCDDNTTFSGGAPYDETHSVAHDASCSLTMVDNSGDGWNGARWTGFGFTAKESGSGSTLTFLPCGPCPPSNGSDISSFVGGRQLSRANTGRRQLSHEEPVYDSSFVDTNRQLSPANDTAEERLNGNPNYDLHAAGMPAVVDSSINPVILTLSEELAERLGSSAKRSEKKSMATFYARTAVEWAQAKPDREAEAFLQRKLALLEDPASSNSSAPANPILLALAEDLADLLAPSAGAVAKRSVATLHAEMAIEWAEAKTGRNAEDLLLRKLTGQD